MRHTVRTHVLIRLHPMSAAAALLPRPNTAERIPPLGPLMWVTSLLSLQKQNITVSSERGPVRSRSTSRQFVWGQWLSPSCCSTPIMLSGAPASSQVQAISSRMNHPLSSEFPVLLTAAYVIHTLKLQGLTLCSKHVKGEFTPSISFLYMVIRARTSDKIGPYLWRSKEVRGSINSQRRRVACFCTWQKMYLRQLFMYSQPAFKWNFVYRMTKNKSWALEILQCSWLKSIWS